MDFCKNRVYSTYSFYANEEMINVWCRSRLKLLTFKHFCFNYNHMATDKRLSKCSPSCDSTFVPNGFHIVLYVHCCFTCVFILLPFCS